MSEWEKWAKGEVGHRHLLKHVRWMGILSVVHDRPVFVQSDGILKDSLPFKLGACWLNLQKMSNFSPISSKRGFCAPMGVAWDISNGLNVIKNTKSSAISAHEGSTLFWVKFGNAFTYFVVSIY